MKSLTEEDKKSLRATAHLAASLFAELPNVDYVICAIAAAAACQKTTS